MITAIDKNTALVLIDLQKGITGRSTVHPVQTVIGRAAELTDAFHKAGLPVVVVNVIPATNVQTRRDSDPVRNAVPMALPADFAEIVKEIRTQPGDIFITKHTWNAFYNTPLQEELKKRNVTGIVLAGVSTSIGVEGTMRAASELGYNIAVATDAITDTNAEAHENSLKRIFPRLAEAGTTAAIIEKLESRNK